MSRTSLIKQFNTYVPQNRSLIRKALDSATGVGEALVPEKLEQVITNIIVRLAPEIAILTYRFDPQKFHEFNRLVKLPDPGGAMGESAVTPTRRSNYLRDSVPMKVIRRKGSVTNFLQDASANYIDAAAAEMENHLLTHVYDIIYYMIWGNAEANGFEYSGVNHFITTNREDKAVGGEVPTSLKFLDDLLDAAANRQASTHKRAFLMSPQMLSKVSQLLENVRLVQGLQGGFSQVVINGGWRLNAYRNVPIIETSSLRPREQMTAVTATVTDGGGTIADGNNFFQVAPITYDGEQLASAEVNGDTSGLGNDASIELSWAKFPGALAYVVYYSTSSGAELKAKHIPAFTYDANGTITGDVTSIDFSSDPSVPGSELTTEEAKDVPLNATGGVPPETVMLWDLDEFQGMGKFAYTNSAGSKFDGLVSIKPLAEVDDDLPFLVKTYGALIPSFEATSALVRGLRAA